MQTAWADFYSSQRRRAFIKCKFAIMLTVDFVGRSEKENFYPTYRRHSSRSFCNKIVGHILFFLKNIN
jgi:hypothetical protein